MIRTALFHKSKVLPQQLLRQTRAASAVQPAQQAAALRTWYNIFGKSTGMYATWLMGLVVVGEFATGKITDGLWTGNNYGHTFTTTDWSKFDQFEDDDEDDDEEEDEDDDE